MSSRVNVPRALASPAICPWILWAGVNGAVLSTVCLHTMPILQLGIQPCIQSSTCRLISNPTTHMVVVYKFLWPCVSGTLLLRIIAMPGFNSTAPSSIPHTRQTVLLLARQTHNIDVVVVPTARGTLPACCQNSVAHPDVTRLCIYRVTPGRPSGIPLHFWFCSSPPLKGLAFSASDQDASSSSAPSSTSWCWFDECIDQTAPGLH